MRHLCALISAFLVIPLALAGTVEESRIQPAIEHMPTVVSALSQEVSNFQQQWVAAKDARTTLQLAQSSGSQLWGAAKSLIRSSQSHDDRPLYWARLQILQTMRDTPPGFPIFPDDRAAALKAFEHASRGMDDVRFPEDRGVLRVLLTGFDPFLLDRHLDQSNPSGVVALMLDGTEVTFRDAAGRTRVAHIAAAVFPVRFKDFDEGIVEDFLSPWMGASKTAPKDWLDAARERLGGAKPGVVTTPPKVDLILTISMGGLTDTFNIERFVGRRRSARAPDNMNQLSGGSLTAPVVPMLGNGPLIGPEFGENSLPVRAMQAAPGAYKIADNHWVRVVPDKQVVVDSLTALFNQTAVEGGGGGYLSNEISYRSIRLRDQLGVNSLPVGHLHTPRYAGFDPAANAAIVQQVRAIITAAAQAVQANVAPGGAQANSKR